MKYENCIKKLLILRLCQSLHMKIKVCFLSLKGYVPPGYEFIEYVEVFKVTATEKEECEIAEEEEIKEKEESYQKKYENSKKKEFLLKRCNYFKHRVKRAFQDWKESAGITEVKDLAPLSASQTQPSDRISKKCLATTCEFREKYQTAVLKLFLKSLTSLHLNSSFQALKHSSPSSSLPETFAFFFTLLLSFLPAPNY